MDRRRLRTCIRKPASWRRIAGRPLRRQARLHDRSLCFHTGLGALQRGADDSASADCPRTARNRRRIDAADLACAAQPCDRRTETPDAGDLDLGRRGRAWNRARSGTGRRPGRGVWLAQHLRREPADWPGRAVVDVRHLPESPRSAVRSLDPVGQAFAILALAALTYALISAGRAGTTDAASLAATRAFVVPTAAFVITESLVRHPMLPLGLFGRPGFSATAAVGL